MRPMEALGGRHHSVYPESAQKKSGKKVKVKSLSCVRLLATPWTAADQVPPSMGFSRQEYWSGVPLPSAKEERGSHLSGLLAWPGPNIGPAPMLAPPSSSPLGLPHFAHSTAALSAHGLAVDVMAFLRWGAVQSSHSLLSAI